MALRLITGHYWVRVVQGVVAHELLGLAANREATPEARAAAEWGLRRVLERVRAVDGGSPSSMAHRQWVAGTIDRFFERAWAASEESEPLPGPGWARDGERGGGGG